MADESSSRPNDGGRRAFGELEGDVLAVLWSEDHPLTPGEIHDALASQEREREREDGPKCSRRHRGGRAAVL